MSTADKRRAVSLALSEFTEFTGRHIAELCGVGYQLVGNLRKDANVDESSTSGKKIGRDGKLHAIKAAKSTGKISKTSSRSSRSSPSAVSEPEVVVPGPATAEDHGPNTAADSASEVDARLVESALAQPLHPSEPPLPPTLPGTPNGQITAEIFDQAVTEMARLNDAKATTMKLDDAAIEFARSLATRSARAINANLAALGMGKAAIEHAAGITCRAASLAFQVP